MEEFDFYRNLKPECGVFKSGKDFYKKVDQIMDAILYKLGVYRNSDYDDLKSSLHVHFLEQKAINVKYKDENGKVVKEPVLDSEGKQLCLNFYQRFDPTKCGSFASWIYIGAKNYLINLKIKRSQRDINSKCVSILPDNDFEEESYNASKFCSENDVSFIPEIYEDLELIDIVIKLKNKLDSISMSAILKNGGLREQYLSSLFLLLLQGSSGVEIAKETGVSSATVNSWKLRLVEIANELLAK